MTREKLPPQAVTIKAAVAKAAFSSTTVRALEQILHSDQEPSSVPSKRPDSSRHTRAPTTNARAVKVVGNRARRQPSVAVLEDCNEACVWPLREKFKLATEVVNTSLKLLTSALQSRPERPAKLGEATPRSESRHTCTSDLDSGLHTALQSLSINSVSKSAPEKEGFSRSSVATSKGNAPGLLATARCGSLAFAILRSVEDQKEKKAQAPDLQLEHGMSVFIGKLIGLKLYDSAIEELQTLRTRLSALDVPLACEKERTRRASKISVKPSIASEDPLQGLLEFWNTKAKGQLLDLMIAAQMQCLKVIAARGNAQTAEAAKQHLDLDNPCSPAKLIEQQIDRRSPQTSTKAAHQLEAVSRLLLQIGNGFVSEEPSPASRKSTHPSVNLWYNTLAMEIRLQWWDLAGHRGDVLKEIVKPFERLLVLFQRDCTMTEGEKYTVSQDYVERILTRLENIKNHDLIHNVEQAMSRLQLTLAATAQDCSRFREADRWMNESYRLLLISNATNGQLCTSICKLAALSIRSQLEDGELQATLKMMKDLSATLEQKRNIELDEVADVVTALNGFRKAVLAILRTHQQTSTPMEQNTIDLIVQSSKTLCRATSFMHHIVSRQLSQTDEEHVGNLRLVEPKLLWDVIIPLIELPPFLAKRLTACSSKEWKSIDAGLQRCILLGQLYEKGAQTPKPGVKDSSRIASCFVSVSNAYWCRFLNRRQNSADSAELQNLLAASIKAVSDQPMTAQDAALISTKHEKRALLYESSGEFVKAAEAYAEIVKSPTTGGSITVAADAAATKAGQFNPNMSAASELLVKSVSGYLKALCNERAGDILPRVILDLKELSPQERGLILEYQLTAARSIFASLGCTAKTMQMIHELGSALLSTYTIEEFPIRRLRVTTKLAYLLICYPPVATLKVFEQLSSDWPSGRHPTSLGQDAGLEQFNDHLTASREIYALLSDSTVNLELLDRSLTTWSSILQTSSNWRILETVVDDIADWLLLLGVLEQFLELRGLEHHRVLVLKLLIKLHESAVPVQTTDLVSRLSTLGVLYTRLGYSGHAGLVLDQAQRYISAHTVPVPNAVSWHIAYAEYILSIGVLDKSDSHLLTAELMFKSYDYKNLGGHQAVQLVSNATSCYVKQLMAKGEFSRALSFCRLRVKLLHRVWSPPEERTVETSSHERPRDLGTKVDAIASSMNALSTSMSALTTGPFSQARQRSKLEVHPLIPQLFDALTSLAEIYAHEGLFPESQYYMEQSAKIASNASGTIFHNLHHAQLGHYLVRGGSIDQGAFHLDTAEALWRATEPIGHNITLQLALAEKYVKSSDLASAMSALTTAELGLDRMMLAEVVDCLGPKQSDTAVLERQKVPVAEALQSTKSKVKNKSKAIPSSGAVCSTTTSLISSTQQHKSDLLALQCTRARLVRCQASIALHEGDTNRVHSLLEAAGQWILTPLDRIAHTALAAKLALRRALSNMASDLVYCIIPESTTCCPSTKSTKVIQDVAVERRAKGLADHQSGPARSKQGRANTKATKLPKSAALPDFVELLCQSREEWNKICSLVTSAGSTKDLHTFVDGLTTSLRILTAFPQSKSSYMQSPLFAIYVMEIGRTIAMSKQRRALQIEQQLSATKIVIEWPAKDRCNVIPSHELFGNDLASFQSQYLDIIPATWNVLSLTLSESRDEIRVTNLRRHHSPFILNLPLARHSQDGDEEAFGFDQGKAELQDIINLANYSTHDAPDTSRKGARTAWWDARAALDARLKDLLVNIESIWFGGFRGALADSMANPDLLARFQQSLNNVLDKHLPSRQKQTKTQKQDQVVFDSHVLELFVNLGNPNDRDLDEELLDLLYFAIDILQFHGERNAYDEVDFDAITIDLLDALRQYHEAARNQDNMRSSQHTILILDKALHCFPWESLPCLKGQAVSRLPSLGCLRDRICLSTKQQQSASVTSSDPVLSVNSSSGAYVINPGGDLTATQMRFEEPLERLTDWEAVKEREPSEGEIKSALESKDIFLYFGHGSGSQYIRSRTIQKLDKCAVALLMGCSSGALTEAGDFESYGTPINYMQAGCPAVLATLWDVTDKDIDRFSQTVLEKWGLFEESQADVFSSPVKKGAKSRGKSKVIHPKKTAKERRSLDQAVAESRDSCIMRYLNGAAPVIYGVPVMLSCD